MLFFRFLWFVVCSCCCVCCCFGGHPSNKSTSNGWHKTQYMVIKHRTNTTNNKTGKNKPHPQYTQNNTLVGVVCLCFLFCFVCAVVLCCVCVLVSLMFVCFLLLLVRYLLSVIVVVIWVSFWWGTQTTIHHQTHGNKKTINVNTTQNEHDKQKTGEKTRHTPKTHKTTCLNCVVRHFMILCVLFVCVLLCLGLFVCWFYRLSVCLFYVVLCLCVVSVVVVVFGFVSFWVGTQAPSQHQTNDIKQTNHNC